MNQRNLDLLYRSLDTELSEGESVELKRALASSQSLRDEKARILAMRAVIRDNALRSFKPFFAGRVMSRLKSLEMNSDPMEELFRSLQAYFRTVAVAGALALLAMLAFNLADSDGWNLDAVLGVSQPRLAEAWQLNVLPESN